MTSEHFVQGGRQETSSCQAYIIEVYVAITILLVLFSRLENSLQ